MVYGAEALLRWHSEALGFVSPDEFIPVAEQSGLIVEIGEWLLGEVNRQLKIWQACPDWPSVRVSLNVSACQFSSEENTNSLLKHLCAGHRDLVSVELTESALVAYEPFAAPFLNGIKKHGFRVALDDYGTGYSSFGYLRDFDFDIIKIDKSFIDGLDSAKQMGIVASIVAMGRILGMRIVAEGVEEESQVMRLRQIGCDFIQGYFFSKPLPAEDFERFVFEQKPSD